MNALELVRRQQGVVVTVVGDVMLDKFVWGNVRRISPEAPVPVVEIERESFRLGGAANVAANIRQLGASVRLLGVVGDDDAASELRHELERQEIDAQALLTVDGRPTTLKTRVVASQQQIVRTDRELNSDLAPDIAAELANRVSQSVASSDAVILSDYAKGALTQNTIRGAVTAAREANKPILVDPKMRRFRDYVNVTLITPNLEEARRFTGRDIDSRGGLETAAKQMMDELDCNAVLITLGEHGMSLFESGKETFHIPAAAREVFDVTGAGDTVIATVAVAMASGASLADSAQLANQAAGIAVGKLGTTPVSLSELNETLS